MHCESQEQTTKQDGKEKTDHYNYKSKYLWFGGRFLPENAESVEKQKPFTESKNFSMSRI